MVVLGVNADDSRDTAKAVLAHQGSGKRSWWDSGQGPIAARWNVQYFPTVYVVDAAGVIRYKAHAINDRELQATVNALLHEQEISRRGSA